MHIYTRGMQTCATSATTTYMHLFTTPASATTIYMHHFTTDYTRVAHACASSIEVKSVWLCEECIGV